MCWVLIMHFGVIGMSKSLKYFTELVNIPEGTAYIITE